MTRKIISLVTLALLAFIASAQDIAGRWMTSLVLDNDDEAFMLIELNLQPNKNAELAFALAGNMPADEEITVEILIRSFANGTWAKNNDKLSFNIDTDNVKYELSELKINGEDAGDLRTIFEKELIKEATNEFNEFWKMFNIQGLTIISVTDKTLVLSDGEIEMTLERKE